METVAETTNITIGFVGTVRAREIERKMQPLRETQSQRSRLLGEESQEEAS